MNALTVVFAALCIFAIGYRFYGLFIANKVLNLNDARVTPAVKYSDGHDYVDTNKYVLFGHHFAAIAAAGPLLGPVLAAQFGYHARPALDSRSAACWPAACTTWSCCSASVRHRGQSLWPTSPRRKSTTRPARVAAWAVLAILLLTLAGLSIAVVNAMHNSACGPPTPWPATIPIAIIDGACTCRSGARATCSAPPSSAWSCSALCILTGPVGRRRIPNTFGWLDIDKKPEMIHPDPGCTASLASVLPVWMLLLPRDYLSTFLKIGTIGALAIGIAFVMPDVPHAGHSRNSSNGGGPIIGGPVIPFLFITIACGALSGFHATIGTGTTPKMINNEKRCSVCRVRRNARWRASWPSWRSIAACVLVPADYFAINAPAEKFAKLGMDVVELPTLEAEVQENLMHRPGGSVSLAVGMAHIFSKIPAMESLMAYWYHFAIMFEAVFILTAVDAGTRVGRFFLQEMIGKVIPKLRLTRTGGPASS